MDSVLHTLTVKVSFSVVTEYLLLEVLISSIVFLVVFTGLFAASTLATEEFSLKSILSLLNISTQDSSSPAIHPLLGFYHISRIYHIPVLYML